MSGSAAQRSAWHGRVSKTVNFKEYNLELGSAERYEARWHNTGQRETMRGSTERLGYLRAAYCLVLIWAIAGVVDAMVMALDEGAMNL